MSARFADGALRLSAALPRLLGWAPGTFWAATPAEVVAILNPGGTGGEASGLSRDDLSRMMERERNG